MKHNQPELSEKLLRYQDKCSDVLASVFLDNQSADQIKLQPIIDALTKLADTTNNTLSTIDKRISSLEESQHSIQKQLPNKKLSSWSFKMFPKYQLLMDYFDIDRKVLYHNLFTELQNLYPDIDINQEMDDYCYANNLDSCFTLEVIEHTKHLRKLFESLVDGLLEKYSLVDSNSPMVLRQKTIFDD